MGLDLFRAIYSEPLIITWEILLNISIRVVGLLMLQKRCANPKKLMLLVFLIGLFSLSLTTTQSGSPKHLQNDLNSPKPAAYGFSYETTVNLKLRGVEDVDGDGKLELWGWDDTNKRVVMYEASASNTYTLVWSQTYASGTDLGT